MEFFTFIAVCLPSVAVFVAAVLTGVAVVFEDGPVRTPILGLCVGITPACLSLGTICGGYELELKRRSVKVMYAYDAYGYDQRRLNAGVRKAILIDSDAGENLDAAARRPDFTEAIFSFLGIGSLILLAVQRTDVNVSLASIVGISVAINIMGLLASVALCALEPRDR